MQRVRFSSRRLAAAVACAIGLSAHRAGAQVHWDVGANGGVARRVHSGGAGDGGFGPTAGLQGHVALLPLVRVGAYGAYERAPNTEEPAARDVFSGGLRVKGTLPWLRGKLNAWVFVGAGYVGVRAPSYRAAGDARVSAGGGGHLEAPVGLGLGYRFKKPWSLTLEAGTRFGFAFTGSLYDGRGAVAEASRSRSRLIPLGDDTLTPFAVLGVSLDL